MKLDDFFMSVILNVPLCLSSSCCVIISALPLQFDWLGFVKAVVRSSGNTAHTVSSSEPVIVRVPQYFKELFKLINATDPRYTHLCRQMSVHWSLRATVCHKQNITVYDEVICKGSFTA